MSDFDLFRLNCFLNDVNASDFKNIIISLVTEYIFDNNNEDKSLDDCYKYLESVHKIPIEKDFFDDLITNSSNFEKKQLHNVILIKITSKKHTKIHNDIEEHNIDKYIDEFLNKNNYDISFKEDIKALIYKAIYDNIHTFSTENLNSLISENLKENFSRDQINIFNEFLEYNNYKKNSALYNIFLKATEFAIVTSGRGVKSLSQDIFKGKRYCLDTNIILRLLGVGGKERRDSLIKLLKSCIHQGISFEYTGQTLQELKRTLSSNVKYLKSVENKYDTIKLGEIAENDPQFINDDFITHYSKLKFDSTIANPDQYEIQMLAGLKKLEQELNLSISIGTVPNEIEKTKFSSHLHKVRKNLIYGRNYTKTAANIDAYNILFVRNLRGSNNYNYVDVKSFYLTTDRTLNDILANEEKNILIPETILPSQLFILHNPYMSNGEEVDYELFLQFVKRRTTEYCFKGGEVLNYINEIRKSTSSDSELQNILYVYADKRYEVAKKNEHNNKRTIVPIKEIIDTYMDEKIKEGQRASDDLRIITDMADQFIVPNHKKTRNFVRILDCLITILLIPIVIVISRKYIDNLYYIIGITVFVESLKFLITSKTRLWNNLWKYLLKITLKQSSYFKLTSDVTYIEKGFENYNKVDGDIWKKLKL